MKKLCPFKKTTYIEHPSPNVVEDKITHEKFEPCDEENCMAYISSPCWCKLIERRYGS